MLGILKLMQVEEVVDFVLTWDSSLLWMSCLKPSVTRKLSFGLNNQQVVFRDCVIETNGNRAEQENRLSMCPP